MGLLDRHIFKNVLFTCLGAVGFFTFIMMAANALKDLVGYFLSGRLSPGTMAELLFWLMPYAVMYALPMGILCGVLLVLGRMSAESEITAMRAAGLGLWRIARPIYVLGATGLVCGLFVNLQFMPVARVKYKQELLNAVRTDPKALLVPKTFVREFKRMVVYVGERQGDIVKDVWVWRLDAESRVISCLKAESGRISFDDTDNSLVFTAQNAILETRDDKMPESFTEMPTTAPYESSSLKFPLEKLFGQQVINRKPDWLTFPVLLGEIERLKQPVVGGDEVARVQALTKHRIVLQDKLAKAVAVLAFVFIAVPLGIKVSRRETSANLVVAVALALAYYFLTEAAKWLEAYPQARPDLLLWLPNLIFVYLGLRWMKRVQSA
ncbi:LptF/LptG family permease [Nibricoccus aquaticus]|uniref:LptF/LptG family permease n=1 Tax=Nibricoccus aquaticus TaxID=2576891 RepID=UPI001586871A|nr:LptF/LptG family permease [Nibricoccus aquaticus]